MSIGRLQSIDTAKVHSLTLHIVENFKNELEIKRSFFSSISKPTRRVWFTRTPNLRTRISPECFDHWSRALYKHIAIILYHTACIAFNDYSVIRIQNKYGSDKRLCLYIRIYMPPETTDSIRRGGQWIHETERKSSWGGGGPFTENTKTGARVIQPTSRTELDVIYDSVYVFRTVVGRPRARRDV